MHAKNDSINGLNFAIKWLNGGHTPAIRCRAFIDNKVVIHAPYEIPVFKPDEITDIREFMLIPGVPVSGASVFVSDEEIGRLRNKECKIFLYGRTDYEVVYPVSPEAAPFTEVCIEVAFAGLKADGNLLFSFTPIGKQNGAR